MRRLPAFALAAVVLVAPRAGAQRSRADTLPIGSGARVRVTSPSLEPAVGEVLASSADTLVLQLDGSANTLSIPLDALMDLEVSRGMHDRRREYGVAGMIVGFGITAARGAHESCGLGNSCFHRDLRRGIVGGLAGALLGVLVGSQPTERWERVPLGRRVARATITPAIGRSAFALAASISF
jgi:hypothetical protein